MKQKLSFTIDAGLLLRAKRYARSRGVLLTSLIGQSLGRMAGENPGSFASRWRGKFRAADRTNEPRYDALTRKYLQ